MKRIYTFGNGQAEGRADMKNLLGGKGANLAEMNLIGVPVPPGFTITTEVCTEYNTLGREAVVKILEEDVKKSVAHIEKLTGNTFGDAVNPLLVSVRTSIDARYDGHSAQSRYQRHRSGGSLQEVGQPTLRMGQLPPLRADVWRRCSRHEAEVETRHRSV